MSTARQVGDREHFISVVLGVTIDTSMTSRSIARVGISPQKLQTFRAMKLDGPDHVPVKWTDEMVRCAVIDLLNELTQSTLARLSPLSQSTISNIANSKYLATLSADKCQDFGVWYTTYTRGKPDPDSSDKYVSASRDNIRMTFHPLYELPKMRDWFNMHPSPTEDVFQTLTDEINCGDVRQQRPPVSRKQVKIWWRNEKVRRKRLLDQGNTGEKVPRKKTRRRTKQEMRETCTAPSGCSNNESMSSLHNDQSPSRSEPDQMSPLSSTGSERQNFSTVDRNALHSPVYHPSYATPLGVRTGQELPLPISMGPRPPPLCQGHQNDMIPPSFYIPPVSDNAHSSSSSQRLPPAQHNVHFGS